MNQKLISHYEESGKSSPLGFLIALIAIAGCSMVLAVAYSLLIYINPLSYINPAITVLAAVVMSKFIPLFSILGKIRSSEMMKRIAVLFAIGMLFFSWSAYILIISRTFSPLNYLQQILDPISLIHDLPLVHAWTQTIFTAPLNHPIIIYIFWFMEAAIFVVVPIYLTRNTNVIPYSEKMDKWYKEYELETYFEWIEFVDEFQEEVSKNAGNAIQNLAKGFANKYARIRIFYLEGEEQHYVTVDNVEIINKKKKEYQILDKRVLDSSTAKDLMQTHRAKRLYLSYLQL